MNGIPRTELPTSTACKQCRYGCDTRRIGWRGSDSNRGRHRGHTRTVGNLCMKGLDICDTASVRLPHRRRISPYCMIHKRLTRGQSIIHTPLPRVLTNKQHEFESRSWFVHWRAHFDHRHNWESASGEVVQDNRGDRNHGRRTQRRVQRLKQCCRRRWKHANRTGHFHRDGHGVSSALGCDRVGCDRTDLNSVRWCGKRGRWKPGSHYQCKEHFLQRVERQWHSGRGRLRALPDRFHKVCRVCVRHRDRVGSGLFGDDTARQFGDFYPRRGQISGIVAINEHQFFFRRCILCTRMAS